MVAGTGYAYIFLENSCRERDEYDMWIIIISRTVYIKYPFQEKIKLKIGWVLVSIMSGKIGPGETQKTEKKEGFVEKHKCE